MQKLQKMLMNDNNSPSTDECRNLVLYKVDGLLGGLDLRVGVGNEHLTVLNILRCSF